MHGEKVKKKTKGSDERLKKKLFGDSVIVMIMIVIILVIVFILRVLFLGRAVLIPEAWSLATTGNVKFIKSLPYLFKFCFGFYIYIYIYI